jgi:hypothetical protein
MRALVVLLLLVAPLALAQTKGPKGSAAAPPDPGARPGDEALTCEQIQAELSSVTAGPGFQNLAAQQQGIAALAANQLAAHPEARMPPAAAAQLNSLAAGAASAPGAQSGGAEPAQSTANQPSADAAAAPTDEQSDSRPKRGGMFKGIGKALGGVGGAFGGGRAQHQSIEQMDRQMHQMAAEGKALQEAQRPLVEAQQAQLAGMSPQVMRGTHLTQLAAAKGCAAQQDPAKH